MEPQDENRTKQRICDYCNESAAMLFCRADTARLCVSCDRHVHSANQLVTKHLRWQLCDACSESPASIFCETEHSVLCQNCDWERHNFSVSLLHHRRPIEGFTGCPSVGQFVNIFGFDDLGNKGLFLSEEKSSGGDGDLDGLLDLFVWETPTIASLDELIVSSETKHGFRALDVPSVPKNRNATCGQHKEEMLQQLRELAKSEPNFNYDYGEADALKEVHSIISDQNLHPVNSETISFPGYKSSEVKWFGDGMEVANQVFVPSVLGSCTEENAGIPDINIDTGGSGSWANDCQDEKSQNPISFGNLPLFPKIGAYELNTQERDSAISRYKEKKKARRYDKHIRYESRKVRAEGRTRIKGRFAKVEH
ncbi:hypothetical protein SLEP1_g23270 [Rubroshorea leprosula]|uniref:Zinc finger protein CONSTANS-LIKE 13 n=2 Tax=Rubroshorea leprosula TaxID=152421 RepID=A0AAV5JBW2_9ROSI|nr:hypothetical protein SLEP1_g23270 [Rubroshorea leprosula]